MKPEVFMTDFERTEWADGYFGKIGRALVFATRFEASVRGLALLLDVKGSPDATRSEEQLSALVEVARERRLFKDIKRLGLDGGEVGEILTAARNARNRIAHEIGIGFDYCIDFLPESAMLDLEQSLSEAVQELAKGDRIVCALTTIATNDHIPTLEFFDAYPALVEKWVCES